MTRYVFVPGAGGAGWYWSRVAARLASDGHQPICVELPGDDELAGLAAYAELVGDAIDHDAETVLVALSLGGFTLPLVAQQTTVRALVFVNAMIPAPGERAEEWWGNTNAQSARLAAAEQHGYAPGFDLQTYFLHDVSPEVAAEAEAYQGDEADIAFSDPCEFASWPPLPIRVVVGADDRFFPLEFQRRVARERLGVEVDVLPGGHLMTLSQPDVLAGYLGAV